jgi:uncharacterized membrane protein
MAAFGCPPPQEGCTRGAPVSASLRRRRVAAGRGRALLLFLSILVVGVAALGCSRGEPAAHATAEPAAGDAGASAVEEDVARIPLADLEGTRAVFYTHESEEGAIRYFVLRSSDGVVRAAFDACDVCFEARLGYRQEGDELVCNNCGTRFPSEQVNDVQGGCNPSPLAREVQGEYVLIQIADIEAGARFF